MAPLAKLDSELTIEVVSERLLSALAAKYPGSNALIPKNIRDDLSSSFLRGIHDPRLPQTKTYIAMFGGLRNLQDAVAKHLGLSPMILNRANCLRVANNETSYQLLDSDYATLTDGRQYLD